MQARFRASAPARPALHASERVDGPATYRLIDHDGAGGAGLLAQAAQNAIIDLVVDMALQAGGRLLGLNGVKRRLRLFEERAERHPAQFEATHEFLPFRAADARINGQHDHVDVG